MDDTDPFSKTETQRSFAAGQTIVLAEEPGDNMFIVVEGQVDILARNQVIETVGPGGILGELALIDDKPRSASAIARTDCLLTLVTRSHFLLLVQRTPVFALQVMRVMSERLRRETTRA
ncbi:MAG: cyclic nucleotide-binding domain-containing protein [Candidatus Competibacteraceae bacterium]